MVLARNVCYARTPSAMYAGEIVSADADVFTMDAPCPVIDRMYSWMLATRCMCISALTSSCILDVFETYMLGPNMNRISFVP